jgi:hypothetical protein
MVRYRRYLIGLSIVALLVGIYAAVGFLAVPYFARRSLQDFVRTHYQRTLSIGELHFNPFTLKLDALKVALPDADGQVLLAFERLHVDLQLASIWRLGPSFREILLEQPYVRTVIRADGALNLADLGKGFPPEPQAEPKKKSAPLRLFIGRLAVTGGNATFEDRTRPTPFHAEFKPIEFELRDFSTRARVGSGNAYSLEASSPEGERLTWNGTLNLDPLDSRGAFELAGLHARTLWNYLRDSVPFEIDTGEINIKGDYLLTSSGAPTALTVNLGSASVTNLGVKPKGGTQDYVGLARLQVDGTHVDVNQHAVTVTKVQLTGGDFKVWLNEQRQLNLLELAGSTGQTGAAPPAAPAANPAAPAPAAAPGTPPAAAWTVSVPDIALEGFKVAAEDRSVKPAATLLVSPLNVHIAGFNLAPDNSLDVTLDATVNGSGKVGAKARVTPHTGDLSAHLEVAELGLPVLQPYIGTYTSMTLLKGALGAKLDIERHADGSLALKGMTQLAGLRTVDNALKQDFIKWRDLRVADLQYRSVPASLRVGSITALEPYVRMTVEPDRSTNIGKVLTAPGAATSAPPAPEAKAAKVANTSRTAGKQALAKQTAVRQPAAAAQPPTAFPLSIGTIRIVNGSANYADLWIKPSFAVGIQSLGGTISGLSSDPRSRAKVQLDGKVDRYSPVHIAGDINLLSAALYTDITMGFKDLDLTIVNPYSGHFAGYKIDKGKLSVDVSYKVEQRKLAAQQHFVIDQLELGDKVDSPDATHLPLKLAVVLLRDRNGVIDLDLPMNGSLDDPTFRIGPIIWKIFVNLIVKAATAPFALLGHLFGGGEHMNIVEFDPGSAELAKPAKEQMAALAKSLKERPQIKLDVPIVFSKKLDQPQLASARLQQELSARAATTRAGKKHPDTAAELALADPQQHFELLVEQYRADMGKDAQLPPTAQAIEAAKKKDKPPFEPAIADLNAALIDHVQVPDTELEALGKQRAQAIQDALLADGQIEPARVFIVNAPPKPEDGDKVKVEMAVK